MRNDDPSASERSQSMCSWMVVGAIGTIVCVGSWLWIQDDVSSQNKRVVVREKIGAKSQGPISSVVEVRAPEPEVIPQHLAIKSIASDTASQAPVRVAFSKSDAHASAIIWHANELVRTQPAHALRMLLEIPESAERDSAVVHAASQWAAVEARVAAAWAAELAPGALREQVCVAVATARAERDPRGAAEFVATQISDRVHLRNAAVAVAQRWVQSDGPAAMQWVAEFPEADVRRMALDATLRVWRAIDAPGLKQWVRDRPPGPLNEEIVRAMSTTAIPSE